MYTCPLWKTHKNTKISILTSYINVEFMWVAYLHRILDKDTCICWRLYEKAVDSAQCFVRKGISWIGSRVKNAWYHYKWNRGEKGPSNLYYKYKEN